MREIINFGFKGGDKLYIGTTKYGTQLPEEKNKCKITYDKTFLKLTNNFILGQCFFQCWKICFPSSYWYSYGP